MAEPPLNVIIGCRSGLMRDGLAALISASEATEPVRTIGKAGSMSGLLHLARQRKWDIAVITDDIAPDNGLTVPELASALGAECEFEKCRIIVLLGLGVPLDAETHTHATHNTLWPANTVLAGIGISGDTFLSILVASSRGSSTAELNAATAASSVVITAKERQILHLIAEGLSNKEIATQTGIGVQTVKNHVSRLLQKLEMQDRVQLAVFEIDQLRGTSAKSNA